MDPELMALASTAGSTVVGLLATDAWEKTKSAVGSFWRRARPDQAESVDAELVVAHEELLAARLSGDATLEESLAGEWQTKLRRLLAANPQLAVELRRLIDEDLGPALRTAEPVRAGDVHMEAKAWGQGRIYQASGDQHITER